MRKWHERQATWRLQFSMTVWYKENCPEDESLYSFQVEKRCFLYNVN